MFKRTGKLHDCVVNHAGYTKAGDLAFDKVTMGYTNITAVPFLYRNHARTALKPYMLMVYPRT
ncbi:hypothetical protein D3C85_580630 [compost metagenome]